MPKLFGPYPARVLDWHDGDTCHVDVDLGFGFRLCGYALDGSPMTSCRLFGINAPELRTDAGKAARVLAIQLCPPGSAVTLVSHSWDKYGGRFDGSLTLADGSDFAQRMLSAGGAVPLTS